MKLEAQIEKLAELGVPLNDGVTIDDLLRSWSRAEYENAPFDLILYRYGCEIDEEESETRFICDRAWLFDTECIEDNGDYVEIVEQFHRITGRKKTLSDLTDHVDIENSQASLQYTIDGVRRELDVTVDNDWVDPETIQVIMDDMLSDGYRYYPYADGQAAVWFCMTPDNAFLLNSLTNNFFGLDKKPWWKFW